MNVRFVRIASVCTTTAIDKKTGRKKRQNKWYYDALCKCKTSDERSRLRRKTFPGIAKAIAEQWVPYLWEVCGDGRE